MLVLSRKQSQRILIGPDIALTVVRIDRNQVRIGDEAPANMKILRDELKDHETAAQAEPDLAELETMLWTVG